eukprot:8649019-Lingulodinium_polyedra.AAC.1
MVLAFPYSLLARNAGLRASASRCPRRPAARPRAPAQTKTAHSRPQLQRALSVGSAWCFPERFMLSRA